MFNSGQLQKKWQPLLEAEGLDKITDNHRKAVTAQLLENQERFLREERAFLSEAPPTVNTDPSSTGNPGFSGSAAVGGPAVSYTHLRAHETVLDLVCRLLLEKKKI